MKKLFLALMMLAGFTAAHAQLTGNIGATTDYRFRGISQTQTGSTLQGGVDYAFSNGFYVGNWNSGVSDKVYHGSNGIESDLYAGVKRKFGSVNVDAGVLQYRYAGSSSSNTTEVYASATTGALNLKASQSTGDYFGVRNSKGTRYLELNVAQPIGKSGFTAVAHAGHTDVANHAANNYQDYSVGVTTTVKGFDVSAKAHTNNMSNALKRANTVDKKDLFKDSFVVAVSKSF